MYGNTKNSFLCLCYKRTIKRCDFSGYSAGLAFGRSRVRALRRCFLERGALFELLEFWLLVVPGMNSSVFTV